MSDMNLDQLQQKLFAAARQRPADDRVPPAFERRVMARLRERAAVDPLAWWSAWLWRAALSACAVALVCGTLGLSLAGGPEVTAEAPLELAASDLENALYAPAVASAETW